MINILQNIKQNIAEIKTAIKLILDRKDSKIVLSIFTIVYFLIYLFSVGSLSFSESSKISIFISKNFIDLLFRSTGYFSFEPIAKIQILNLLYLFSPINFIFQIFLSGLVGLNISFLYLGIVEPKKCNINYKGVAASIPALFSGAACCGPIIFILIGIQATSILISLFELLLPISITLLIISLVLISKQINN